VSLKSVAGAVAGQVKGTATNDSAAAGNVGEFLTSTVATGSAVSLTSTTAADVTTLAVTAGDWDVEWTIDFKPGATTSITRYAGSVSLTINTMNTQAGGTGIGTEALVQTNQAAMVPAADFSQASGSVRCSFSASQTLHLVAQATFTVSTLGAYGTIRARRVR
jgi:hypothetical protein